MHATIPSATVSAVAALLCLAIAPPEV